VEQEYKVRYVVMYERSVRSVGLEAAAEQAKRSVGNVKGAKLVAVYDPAIAKMDPIA